MKVFIDIDADNAAFAGARASETTRILETQVIPALSNAEVFKILRDTNGNAVGVFKIVIWA